MSNKSDLIQSLYVRACRATGEVPERGIRQSWKVACIEAALARVALCEVVGAAAGKRECPGQEDKGMEKIITDGGAAALDLLGCKVVDRITGFTGIASSVSFDLYGCIQVAVNPGLDKDGKLKDSLWFDSNRLTVLSDERVMECPLFKSRDKGPAEKPNPKS